MSFNLYHWLFDDPITAGGTGPDGSEIFHYFWPYLIFCGVGLLIWFYYWVEGRKRFLKDYRVQREMLDRYLNWLAVICFVGIPIDLARVVLDGSFFAWRFWRYLWLVALLVWAVWWIVYLFRKFPLENASFQLFRQRQKSMNPPESKAVKDKRAKNAEKEKMKAVKRARNAENAKKKIERKKRKAAKKSKVLSGPR